MPEFKTSVLTAILLMALAIRMPGFLSDFWLDEIWALHWALGVQNPLEIFTRIHFDTNHWLYTFLMYVYGDTAWPVYRIPSMLAGLLTIPLAAWIATRDQGRTGGIIALLLFSLSFPFVFYSSEARGYALLMFFALSAYASLKTTLNNAGPGRWSSILLFAGSCLLGFLSHLTFILPYLAFLVWSAGVCLLPFAWTGGASPDASCSGGQKTGWPVIAGLRKMLALHAVPVVFFCLLYWVDIRHIQHGGGDSLTPAQAWKSLCAWTLGLPEFGLAGWLAFLLVLGLSFVEIIRLAGKRDPVWLFFLTLLFGAPPALVLLTRSDFSTWHSRHFLVCAPFLLLLVIRMACRCFHSSRAGKAIGVAILLGLAAGNGVRLYRFMADGRGGYAEAVRFMAEQTDSNYITVTSDHDFRNSMVLNYYLRLLPSGRTLFYYPEEGAGKFVPEWYILHNTSAACVPPPLLQPRSGIVYRLQKHYPFFGPSGFHWMLYRKE